MASKKELQEQLQNAENLLKNYEDAQVWYVNAVEQLSRIRYEYGQLLGRCYTMPDGRVVIGISKEQYDKCVALQDEVNEYFSSGGKRKK